MGVENNECIIATTEVKESMRAIKVMVCGLSERQQSQFTFAESLCNGKETLFLCPDGSKKGWSEARDGRNLRKKVIEWLETFAYDDGSSPFDWVEVGYGEYGQKVLNGNNKNIHGAEEYAN